MRVGTTVREAGAGNAVFVPSNREHQFRNAGRRELVFLCVKGAEELYSPPSRA